MMPSVATRVRAHLDALDADTAQELAPPASDRTAWEALPATDRAERIRDGEAYLGFAWPMLPATDILAYQRDGNRSRYQDVYNARRSAIIALVLAECVEHEGRFLDELINGIWCVCEETSWTLPAHLANPPGSAGLPDPDRPVVALLSAETAALMSWTHHLLGPELGTVSTRIPARILDEVRDRVLTTLLERDDFWWIGLSQPDRALNNWTPWIVANWLTSILLLEDDPSRRREGLTRAADCLDRFLAPGNLPEDGACDEGPGYWRVSAGALFFCVEQLRQASGGAIDAFDLPLVKKLAPFIAQAHIEGDWFVNFADGKPRVILEPVVPYGYGIRTGNTSLSTWALHFERTRPAPAGGGKGETPIFALPVALLSFFQFPMDSAEVSPPEPGDTWFPVTHVLVSRKDAPDGEHLVLAAKGGHNTESHNHNDVGSFIFYRNGCPLAVDPGAESYTRQSFSRERWGFWYIRSDWHNLLPSFDGVAQSVGRQFAATEVSCVTEADRTVLSMDLQDAYPESTGVRSWRRQLTFEAGSGIRVEDTFAFDRDLGEVTLSFVTPSEIEILSPGTVRFEARALPDGNRSASGSLDVEASTPVSLTKERVAVNDGNQAPSWGDHLNRVVIRMKNPPREGWLRVRVY